MKAQEQISAEQDLSDAVKKAFARVGMKTPVVRKKDNALTFDYLGSTVKLWQMFNRVDVHVKFSEESMPFAEQAGALYLLLTGERCVISPTGLPVPPQCVPCDDNCISISRQELDGVLQKYVIAQSMMNYELQIISAQRAR